MLAKKFEQWSKLKDAVSQKLTEKESEEQNTVSNLATSDDEEAPPLEVVEDTVVHFTFQTIPTMKHLWQEWQNLSKKPFRNVLDQAVKEALGGKVMLTEPLENFNVFKSQRGLVETLTLRSLSWQMWDEKMVAVCQPFRIENLYANKYYANALFTKDRFDAEPIVGESHYNELLMLAAYGIILKEIYDFEGPGHLVPVKEVIFSKTAEGRTEYFTLQFDYTNIKPISRGGVPRLSSKDKKAIIKSPELKTLMGILPPEAFDFEGIMIVEAEHSTEAYCVESIRTTIRNGDIHKRETQEVLTEYLRAYFHSPALVMDGVINHTYRIKRLVDHDREVNEGPNEIQVQDFAESIYHEALEKNDLDVFSSQALTEDVLSKLPGLKRHTEGDLYLLPLIFKDYKVGVMEFHLGEDSPKIPATKLLSLKLVLEEEIERQIQEFRNSILSVILEKYTAIHPTVEWAFRDAAQDYVNQRKAEQMAELKPIAFKRVHPLYGASDIRGSSNQRNLAIQQDLKDQITTAKSVIETAIEYSPMPKLQEIRYRLESEIDRITKGLLAGDEITVLEFLNGEVETVFEAISANIPETRAKIAAYRETINNHHGVFYKARKNFDNSVTLLNEAIAAYYDEEQMKFQSVFPHYFEKQSTDGVDHTIYIGDALSKDHVYHNIYLENIRIWQLQVMCGAAYVADNLKNSLPVPLDLTHLIVVQDNPLDIRFSRDEKQFEVDGAYNVRYEIMKKRIDKAKVKDSDERLTQPGKLAIVYSQKKEKADYSKYLAFLRSEGYFGEEEEDLAIEDLQGISGLRALRVPINLRTFPKSQDAKTAALSNAVSNSRRWLLQKRKEMEETAQKVQDAASSYSERKKAGK